MPTNLIGEWDNSSEQDSHVAMGLIGRFIEAKHEGYSTVKVLGSGKPIRDFIYAGDVAKLIPVFMDPTVKDLGPFIISTGRGTSIGELAEMISKAVDFSGKIYFDTSQPDGQMEKVLSNHKLLDFLKESNIEWEPTPLEEAIAKTVEWYERRVYNKK
jgi:GDP-L-fucose synthase